MRTATFALFIGIAYLSAGGLGLVPAALMPPNADAPPVRLNLLYGELLGIFPVNVLHSAVHLAIGLWGVLAWRTRALGPRPAKSFARALAILYGALALLGVIPGLKTFFGLVPLYGHDVWLHAATAAIAAYFGWRNEVYVERRTDPLSDRRERILPVENDRRVGHADRRAPGSEV
jgi:hypothetical protein